MSRVQVEFLYDFSCPYAYLGSTQIEALAARHGADLVWSPVLLGGLLQASGSPQRPAESLLPQRVRHNAVDVMRWAQRFDVPLSFPPDHPRRTVDALRLVLAAPGETWAELSHGLYRAYWVDNLDLTDRAVLARIADEAGLEGRALVDRIDDPPIKAELRRRTDAAIARGIFGVPTCFVGRQMFWGQDRLHFVEQVLSGENVPGVEALPEWARTLGAGAMT